MRFGSAGGGKGVPVTRNGCRWVANGVVVLVARNKVLVGAGGLKRAVACWWSWWLEMGCWWVLEARNRVLVGGGGSKRVVGGVGGLNWGAGGCWRLETGC